VGEAVVDGYVEFEPEDEVYGVTESWFDNVDISTLFQDSADIG
jgi:hypothetical protein